VIIHKLIKTMFDMITKIKNKIIKKKKNDQTI